MPRTVYNQSSHLLLVGSGTTTTYSPSNTELSLKYFNIQSIFKTFSKVIPKNKNKTKKAGTNFDLITFLNWEILELY